MTHAIDVDLSQLIDSLANIVFIQIYKLILKYEINTRCHHRKVLLYMLNSFTEGLALNTELQGDPLK
jgi:hypothetical protein